MKKGRIDGVTIAVTAVILAEFIQCAVAQITDPAESVITQDSFVHFTPAISLIIGMSMLIIILVLLAIIIMHNRIFSASSGGTATPNRASRCGQSGLNRTILITFPTFTYSEVKSHKIGKGALECAICLSEFADDEKLKLLPKCDHVFHPDCIDSWLESHTTCPVCRANLDQPSEASRTFQTASETESPAPSAFDSSTEEAISDVTEPPRSTYVTIARPEPIDSCKSPYNSLLMKTKTIFFHSKLSKSHSTGHVLVQPGENMDRFTLILPSHIRNQILNRTLNRSNSAVELPTESSMRKGYRTCSEEGSGRDGRSRSPLDRAAQDRLWLGLSSGLISSWTIRPSRNIHAGEGTSRFTSYFGPLSSYERFGYAKEKSSRPEI